MSLSVEPGKNWKSRKSRMRTCSPSSQFGFLNQEDLDLLVMLKFGRWPSLFTHLPISSVVGPGYSVHTVLELKFGEPVVILRTTLDYYSCYFSGLAQIYLDPA